MVPTTSDRSEVKGYNNSASLKKVIDYSDKVVNKSFLFAPVQIF